MFSSYTFGGTGVGYGDLFLSTSWDDVDGSAPYMTDDASTGEVWEYGFSLDDRWMSEDDVGTGRLYSLNANDNLVNTLQSEHFMSGAIFRNGQEIEVDKTSNVTAKSTGTWGIDTEEGTVNFSIDLTDTALLTSDNIAFHWGPSCANDIIEGIGSATVVPIPDAAFLFGSGLMGVIGIARRKNTA